MNDDGSRQTIKLPKSPELRFLCVGWGGETRTCQDLLASGTDTPTHKFYCFCNPGSKQPVLSSSFVLDLQERGVVASPKKDAKTKVHTTKNKTLLISFIIHSEDGLSSRSDNEWNPTRIIGMYLLFFV
jgi:hypothetical protein